MVRAWSYARKTLRERASGYLRSLQILHFTTPRGLTAFRATICNTEESIALRGNYSAFSAVAKSKTRLRSGSIPQG